MNDYKEYGKSLVSIIIPTHNRFDFIKETIDSVVNQTYKYIELILVDDHSKPEYKVYVDSIISGVEGSIVIKLVENQGTGACAARNTGIRVAEGDFVQFFDDDDVMLPNHIEKKVKAFYNGNYEYVACNYTFFNTDNPNTVIDSKDISSIKHTAASHILHKSFPTPCFMCTRETIEKIGKWNERIKKLQDFSYFHRLFLYDCKGLYIDDYLFKVRVHTGSMTQISIHAVEGQIYTLESIQNVKEEWKDVGGEKWETVRLPITFMEFTTGRNLVINGYKKKGIALLLELAKNNPKEVCCLLFKAIQNKTIHLTEVLDRDSE